MKFPMNFFPSHFSTKMAALAYCHAVGTRRIDPPEPNAPTMENDDDPRLEIIAEGNYLHINLTYHLSLLIQHSYL